jgi:hypothetical protein
MPFPPPGAGAGEDEFPDQVGVLSDEGLGHHATEGESEDVHLLKAQGADEVGGVLGHGLNAARHHAGAGPDAAVVEGDDVVLLGNGVDDLRVPVVKVACEVDEEDHGNPALRPQFAVGIADAAGCDAAGGCRRIGGCTRDAGGAHAVSPDL